VPWPKVVALSMFPSSIVAQFPFADLSYQKARVTRPVSRQAPDRNNLQMRDCVVELVGLEPTTRVLWNMGGVRPAHPVEHHSLELEEPLLMGISIKGESAE
jgi:hypothetical protein